MHATVYCFLFNGKCVYLLKMGVVILSVHYYEDDDFVLNGIGESGVDD